jgi:hypothetical protein
VSDAIACFTVEADWEAERPLPDAARAAYAEHVAPAAALRAGRRRRPLPGESRLAASLATQSARDHALDPAGARSFEFLDPAAFRHDWVGGMNEGVDFRRYHPQLVAGPTDG